MPEKNNFNSISISTGTIIRVGLVALGFYLLWILRDLALVVLTSIVIASFVESAVSRMKRIGIGRVLGVVIFYFVTLLVLAGVFYLFAPLLITEIYNFSNFVSEHFPQVTFLDYFKSDAFSGAKDIVNSISDKFSFADLLQTSKAFVTNLSAGFLQTLSVAFGSFVNFILIVVISFFLSIQENGIENFLRIILPDRHEDYAVDLWRRSRHKIALWMKGQMVLGFLIAILTYLTLSILGIEYALFLAIIAGIMELVPYGVIVAMVPAISFSYISGGISSALMVTGAYVIIHQFEAYLLSPLIVKRVVGLSPLVVILAVLIGFEFAGFWGFILSIPVAVAVMEFLNDIEKKKIFSKGQNG